MSTKNGFYLSSIYYDRSKFRFGVPFMESLEQICSFVLFGYQWMWLHLSACPAIRVLPPSVVQASISAASTPLQQPLHMSSMLQMPLQPPLPSHPRPPSLPPYPHQNYSHMGANADYQHPGAPQLHHSQPMFHRYPVGLSSENTKLKLRLQAI
ncbi:hypothetical protein CTI12_AA205920 [Artemisia annua]|uniref:Uncharacterized protein n=1 Tax=Artemisia annua TaxID=35608 RepID=A0A2U1P142_ARTAN|nr:hypothetical protein CTI12_AA205920 [Artemisia annua]